MHHFFLEILEAKKMGGYIKVNIKETAGGLNSCGSEQGPVAGPCGHGNETSGYHKRQGIY
jgi:hypothetical protein